MPGVEHPEDLSRSCGTETPRLPCRPSWAAKSGQTPTPSSQTLRSAEMFCEGAAFYNKGQELATTKDKNKPGAPVDWHTPHKCAGQRPAGQ